MSTEGSNTPEKAKRGRKKLDLSTAKTADGAVRTPTSVYEIVGISTNSYKTTNYEDYKQTLASMNLIDLQEEAYRHGTLATDNRVIIIDRLERKFLQENSRFASASNTAQKKLTPVEENKKQALNILSRGR